MEAKQIFNELLISYKLPSYEVKEIEILCEEIEKGTTNPISIDILYYDLCALFLKSNMNVESFIENLRYRNLLMERYRELCNDYELQKYTQEYNCISFIIEVLEKLYGDTKNGDEFREIININNNSDLNFLFRAIAKAIFPLMVDLENYNKEISYYKELKKYKEMMKKIDANTEVMKGVFYLSNNETIALKSEKFLQRFMSFLRKYDIYFPLVSDREKIYESKVDVKNVYVNFIALRIVKVFIKYRIITEETKSTTQFIEGPNKEHFLLSSKVCRVVYKIMCNLGLELSPRKNAELDTDSEIYNFMKKRILLVVERDKFSYNDIIVI